MKKYTISIYAENAFEVNPKNKNGEKVTITLDHNIRHHRAVHCLTMFGQLLR